MPEGFWLIADRQVAGKGRQGRAWSDAAGNFMGSTLVRLTGHEPAPHTLALVVGVALHETVRARLLVPARLELKWPNDLLLVGAKVAGILLEREGDAVVVGIGVNLANAPQLADRKLASLAQFGFTPDRDAFAADLATAFCDEVDRWRADGLDAILARWLAAAHPAGTRLSVNGRDGQIAGTFAGLEADGAMKLRRDDGSIHIIHAGDVALDEEAE